MDVYHSRPRDEIVEHIECFILENQLKAGDRLPSERKLCTLWNCNRMTFRSAVSRLIAEGKLYSIPSTGNFVAQEKLQRYLQDLTSFSEFVMLHGHRISNVLVSQAVHKASRKMASRLQIDEGRPVFELVRLRVVDDDPVSIEWASLPLDRYPGIERYNFERLSLYSVMEMKYLTIFGGGQEEISITYAEEHEAQLLKVSEGEALFFLRGVTWDEDHRPVEDVKSVIRPDRLMFASTLTK
jgi:GntR family transcriptional regulator